MATTNLTKAEWAQVEDHLSMYYHPVALMCDGQHILLRLERLDTFKNGIWVYVNGKSSFAEEASRFNFPSQRKAHKAKEQRELRKIPKRIRKELGDYWDPDTTITIYRPWWGSFKALKAHLIKSCESLELLKAWGYKPVQE